MEFCDSVFWDTNTVWNTTTPDIPQCFQDTVLIWVPCGILWLLMPLEIHYIRQRKEHYIPWTGLNVARLVLSAVLLSTSAASLIASFSGISSPLSACIGATVQCATYVLVILLEFLDKRNGLHSSAVLFTFWLVQFVASFAVYSSWMIRAFAETSFVRASYFLPVVVAFPIVIAKLILSSVADIVVENKSTKKNPCPVKYSSPLANIFYSWFDSMAWVGYKRQFTNDDLWALDDEYVSVECFNEFDKLSSKYQKLKSSNKTKAETQPSVLKVSWKMNQTDFIIGILIKYVGDILGFVNPLMLKQLINFVSSDEPAWHGYLYAATIFVSSATAMICLNNHLYRMQVIGIRCRAAIVSAIYRKSLAMSNASKSTTTVGEIVTLMSVDAQRLMDVWQYVGFAFSMPLQVSVAIYLLWDMLGPSVIAGLVIIIIIIPMNTVIANMTAKIQIKVMKQKDQRTKLMNELLTGMKVLKLYAWEQPFAEQVENVRSSELKSLRTILYLQAVTTFILQCAPFLIALCTFATYVLIDDSNVLDATKAFVSLSLFDIIRIPLILVPNVIAVVVQTVVSGKRIDAFMRNEDIDPESVSRNLLEDDPVVVWDGTFAWSKESEPVLSNIQLRIPNGNLIAVVGTVGSGKSSLISAILGEMEKICGTVNVKGTTAYVPQQAWIQNATVRNNITFGRSFNEHVYNAVIDACALKTDFEILNGGDQTEIGEKGINLSGGQKQRVSIARAVYADAEIYMLDDPLSAVDSHVGKHIFDKVIGPKGLLQKKTRILVTHGISYLPHVDSIVVLKQGIISEVGSYKELLEKGDAFAEFMMTYLKEQENLDDVEAAELLEMQDELLLKIDNEDVKRRLSQRITRVLSSDDELSTLDGKRKRSSRFSKSTIENRSPQPSIEGQVQAVTKLTKDEFMETGTVDWLVYKKYFHSFGYSQFFLTAMVLTLSWASSYGSNYWLNIWSADQPKPDGTQDEELRNLRLGVYGALGFGQAIFILGAALSMVWGTIRACKVLHNNMMNSVLRSPMEFFDTTPLGRILNRFSRDVDVTDVMIPTFVRPVMDCILQIIGTITIISLGSPIFLVIFIPLGIVYYFIQRLFIDASRQLKRMESVSRSPIYVHFSETISGLSTLRAYRVQDRFIQELEEKMDISNALFFPILGAKRWLGVRLEAVGDAVVLCAALFAVSGRETMDPGVVGLSVNYAMSVTFVLMWLVRNWTDLESNIVSVERIAEYSELKPEAPLEIEGSRPKRSWPEEGEVKFQDYCTRYREGLDLVLRGISCEVRPKEKVGIVGRTGAGKSSLTLALFRLVEASGGAIIIDGMDISQIGLKDLRSRLTIIPQDPVLFIGTLRLNLDPFNMYTDEAIWRALEHSHLKEFISSLPTGLNYNITEGGENLSVGQRQLICLARALLRKTKVLVLDEATAAVDLETDDLIQATIRKEFADCTVLTIAHRLNTILDSNRVIVLDQGVIVEFDTPSALLEKHNSLFYSMARDAGLV